MNKIITASILATLASTANAGIFDGQSVQYQYYFPTMASQYGNAANGVYAVGAGVEVPNISDDRGTLDVQSDGFTVHFTNASTWTSATFNGFVITDINNTIASFTSFSIVSNTGLAGTPVLSFDSDNLYVNWQGIAFDVGDVVFSVNVNAVPEPETYAMMLAGLGLLGFAARRRKQQAA